MSSGFCDLVLQKAPGCGWGLFVFSDLGTVLLLTQEATVGCDYLHLFPCEGNASQFIP
jgi:hypothetical protein